MWTSGRSARRSATLRAALTIAGLVLLTIVIRLPVLIQRQAIDDEVNYSVVAHELMNGGQLYVDVVERRPPLTFWVYEAVFRIAGTDNWRALHAVGVLWVLLTMVMLYSVGARVFNPAAGVAAAAMYSVVQPWWYWGNLAFNGEVLMNLPLAAAFALSFSSSPRSALSRSAAAGALVAVASLLKQPAVVAALPLALYLAHPSRSTEPVSRSERLANVGSFSAGFAAVLAAVALWLVSRGVLREAVYWSVLDHDVPHIFWRQGLVHTATFALICLPLLLGSAWTIRHPLLWRGRVAERAALACFAIVSAIGVAASGRFFPHYYIGLLPPVVVLAAPSASLIWSGAERSRSAALARIGGAWVVGAAAVTLLFQTAAGAALVAETGAGRYIRDHSPADTRVFVWGRMPEIYLDSDRRPAARYIDTFALTGRIFGPKLPGVDTTKRIVPGSWDQLRADFHEHAPEFIVDTQIGRDAEYPLTRFPWLAALIRTQYEAVADVEQGRIYRQSPRIAASSRPDAAAAATVWSGR